MGSLPPSIPASDISQGVRAFDHGPAGSCSAMFATSSGKVYPCACWTATAILVRTISLHTVMVVRNGVSVSSNTEYFIGPPEEPDKYRLVHQVGSGGEAQLWKAELRVSGAWEPVAVKILRTDRLSDLGSWAERWREQAEVLRFIRHPGVVGVREHFEGGPMHYQSEEPSGLGALYLVMNWVEGVPLRDWVPLHHTEESHFESIRYLAQIGDVLDWLHSGQATPSNRPVIHADVTPANVLVTPSGQAVLVDFGLIRLVAGQSATVEGTRGYMAPEVIANGTYSIASDRYAFGALTYFVLTGENPPSDPKAIFDRLGQVPVVAAQPGLADHLMQMFHPDPAQRPPAGDWIRFFRVSGSTSLGSVAGLQPPTPQAVVPPETPTTATAQGGDDGRKRRRAWVIAAAAVVLVAVVVGVVLAVSGGNSPKSEANSPPVHHRALTRVTTTTSSSTSTTTTNPGNSGDSGNSGSDVSGAPLFLSNASTVGGTDEPDTGAATINGTTYPHSIWDQFGQCNSSTTISHDYDLGRKYSTFTATVGEGDTSPQSATVQWDVYLDTTNHPYTKQMIKGTGDQVSISVKNVLTLTLTETYIPPASGYNGNTCGSIIAGWGDAEIAP
jgi:serine/threonine protein kinase